MKSPVAIRLPGLDPRGCSQPVALRLPGLDQPVAIRLPGLAHPAMAIAAKKYCVAVTGVDLRLCHILPPSLPKKYCVAATGADLGVCLTLV